MTEEREQERLQKQLN